MPVNRDKPDLWKADIAKSVDTYNHWFLRFAPKAFRETRNKTTGIVEEALKATHNLTDVRPSALKARPGVLATLRMCTCPPLARDRLAGLAMVSRNLVERMECGALPHNVSRESLDADLRKIGNIVKRLADRDILTWLETASTPTDAEVRRAATIIADRLCGATADPIIRNAQESRQLDLIGRWLRSRGYTLAKKEPHVGPDRMKPGTYAFRMNIPATLEEGARKVKIPVDAAVMPKEAKPRMMPLLLEAKSAGDFANVNKRRKEEAQKVAQLRAAYGPSIRYVLLIGGYFDTGYLGYEAAEGIDWVWEHRVDDLEKLGL